MISDRVPPPTGVDALVGGALTRADLITPAAPAPVDDTPTDWAQELTDGIRLADPARVQRAIAAFGGHRLPAPPDVKLSQWALRHFHPQICDALKKAKVNFAPNESRSTILEADRPDALEWLAQSVSGGLDAIGARVVEPTAERPGPAWAPGVSSTARGAFYELCAHSGPAIGRFLIERVPLLHAYMSDIPGTDLQSGHYNNFEQYWGARLFAAVASVETAQWWFQWPKMRTALARGEVRLHIGAWDTLEHARRVLDMLASDPDGGAWLVAALRSDTNSTMLSTTALHALTAALGWEFPHNAGDNYHHIAFKGIARAAGAATAPPALVDALVLNNAGCVPALMDSPALSRYVRERAAGPLGSAYLLSLMRQPRATVLKWMRDPEWAAWRDVQGNTLSHWLVAISLNNKTLSATAATDIRRADPDALETRNAVGRTPLSLMPADIAHAVERAVLTRARRESAPTARAARAAAGASPSAPPLRRRM